MVPLKLLIADDDPTLAHTLRQFFQRERYQVEVAPDGPSAIAMMDTFRPHMMFLDVNLPGLSGIEVLKAVKTKDASLRVIMITGETDDDLSRQARVLGADDFVTKPFTLSYLNGEVMEKLRRHIMHEYRATSEDLNLERERMRLILDRIQDGVVALDKQGLLVMANQVAKSLLDLPRELPGLTVKEAFTHFSYDPFSDRRNPKPTDQDPVAHFADHLGLPFDLSRAEPSKLIIECHIDALPNGAGYMFLFRDVTQLRKSIDAMKRLNWAAMHKLRTPLMMISGYPRMLLSAEFGEQPLSEIQKRGMTTILKGCERLQEAIDEFITLGSLDTEELERKSVALGAVLDHAKRRLQETLKPEVLTHIHVDRALAEKSIDGDPMRLQLAFQNVIENAFKFGAKDIEINAVDKPDNRFVVQFMDNGRGIPPEDLDRIFEPFYQVDKDSTGQVPGMGLGLSIVKQITEAHGGRVWASSVFGQSATIYVELPAHTLAA